MAPARKRRKLPTLIDRGLGLLEVILPRGSQDDPVSTLPPGQRDTGGFWFPTGYTEPGDIFTPAQRRLQAKQRLVQRHRHESIPAAPPIVSRSKAIATDTTPSRPHAPPGPRPGAQTERAMAIDTVQVSRALADRPMPLPALSREAPVTEAAPHRSSSGHRPPASAASMQPSFPEPDRARAVAAGPIVDSPKGSD